MRIDHRNMAIVRLKFQQLLRIIRVFGIFTNTWPACPNAKKIELFIHDLYYHVAMFVLTVVYVSIMIKTYKSRDDIFVVMRNASHLVAIGETILSKILCRNRRRQLQSLLMSIEEFTKVSKDRERAILQKYTDRYVTFMMAVATSFVMAGITVISGPFFLPLEFPIDVWYPFPSGLLLQKIIIYFMQIFLIAHIVFCLGVDVMIAVLLFYSAARLEMLAFEIQRVTDETHVVSCIRKHQEIIAGPIVVQMQFYDLLKFYLHASSDSSYISLHTGRFISKTRWTIQHLLFKTTLTTGIAVICGLFPILYLESNILIPQFLSMIFAVFQRMYITAWPANDLKEVSTRVAWSAYSAPWIGRSRKMWSNVFIIVQRSQKPLLITMGSLLPAFTLEYYGSFITTVLSYFMTMRAMIGT